MKKFLSCDWGTSSFRLRLVEVPGLLFTSVESAGQGIGKTFELWKQNGAKKEERFSFYLSVIGHHIKMLEQELGSSLKNIPLIVSGMASSSIGMIELPYKEAPFNADGSDLTVKKIPSTTDFSHDIMIISGAKTDNDVMRGEETQLAGCRYDSSEEQIFIFPGTHSKHVRVGEGRVVDIKTYMTGEFFELLSEKSILSVSLMAGDGLQDPKNRESFRRGVKDSAQSNLLHHSFLVRTNDLLGKFTKQENYYYLSGLLIGTELRDLQTETGKKIILVANETMNLYYSGAWDDCGFAGNVGCFEIQNADIALVKGHHKIWNGLNY